MKIKKYIGSTVQEALAQAKRELGGDVVLLESREIGGQSSPFGSKRLIEITTGADFLRREEEKGHPDRSVMTGNGTFPGNGVGDRFSDILLEMKSRSLRGSGEERKILDGIFSIRQELSQLTRQLGRLEKPDSPSRFEGLRVRLIKVGVSSNQSARFVERGLRQLGRRDAITDEIMLDSIQTEMAKEVEHHLAAIPKEEENRQQVMVLVGSSGVGKTMTLMKLAAHPDIFGRKKAAILSTDIYRPAALEPLKAFSRISGIPVRAVKSLEGAREAVERFRNREVILVDTPARSPYFPNYIAELQDYLQVLNPTEILLVLSMTSDLHDLFFSSGFFLTVRPTGFIFTKFDETSRPGKVFSILEEIELPITFMTCGQSVPNDIVCANGQFICDRIMNAL